MTIDIRVVTKDKTELTFKKTIEHRELILAHLQHYIETINNAYRLGIASYYLVIKAMKMLDNKEYEYSEMLGENKFSISLSE